MNDSTRKIFSIAVVAMMAITCYIAIDPDEDREVDAVFGIDDAIIALVVVNALLSGYIIADYILDHSEGTGTDESIVRGYEAKAVAESIINNILVYKTNMLSNQQIWKLTGEHHIRQAELAASEIWSPDTAFDASRIMDLSGVYTNSAYVLDNGASQINAMFDMISESMGIWNSTETYRDKMLVEVGWGSGSVSSKSNITIHLGVSCPDVKPDCNKVYLTTESTLWSDRSSVIVSEDGSGVQLSQGMNDLSAIEGFSPGVYSLSTGASYCGDMMSVIDRASAPLFSGVIIGCDGESKLAIYSDGAVIVDGIRADRLTVTIHPDGAASTTPADITPVLEQFAGMLDAVYATMADAASSAGAVWSIFDSAGQASAYLSTLMVPDVYDGTEVNSAQKSIISILAMEQLASYWTEHGGKLKTDDYDISDSMSIFVRGDIISPTGETAYSDVIFTPFFYQDISLRTGSNPLDRRAIMTIWAEGENLSSWSGITDASKAMIMTADSGYVINIHEMMNGGKLVNSVDLSVNKISIIDPEKLIHDPLDPEPNNDLDRIVMLVMVIVGILAVVTGWRSGNYVILGIGILITILGLFFAGSIAEVLEDIFGWRVELG